MEQTERRREHELLERLRDGIGASGRAAGGLEDVLEALVERRVESLLLAPDFAAAGVVCEECGWLGVDAESCPADGASLQRRANIVDDAIAAAIASGAEVLTVRHHEGLGPLGGIAALLRF
jgi:peptide chain release factor subunit 1